MLHGVDQVPGAFWEVRGQEVSFPHFQERPIHRYGIHQLLQMRWLDEI
jgi:hypothetical protein